MGDGLKRAALAAVCSRAPWSGKLWSVGVQPSTWLLSERDVRAAYARICSGGDRAAIAAALGVDGLSHPKAAKCLQMLRKAKLIKYVTGAGWTA